MPCIKVIRRRANFETIRNAERETDIASFHFGGRVLSDPGWKQEGLEGGWSGLGLIYV